MATDIDHEEIIRQVTEKMTTKFPDADPGHVAELVRTEVSELAKRPIQDYVTVLTERAVKKSLKQEAS
ncbi:hypothetical protein KXS11_10835 [Plantibacter flavus]|uniref:three-helix bundle dimerization domain-containing protein n=1 Tax=Plantibacter flavus TaxID=150123 RepID=UPI003F13E66B